eukprot:GDKJ01016432.1.p4 GENE.GDKJ01016432.1~~GDKJ01016432.1.p4  ORF type:complete len:110 (-),score=7.70 GDKJ01016432.1:133-462(-)
MCGVLGTHQIDPAAAVGHAAASFLEQKYCPLCFENTMADHGGEGGNENQSTGHLFQIGETWNDDRYTAEASVAVVWKCVPTVPQTAPVCCASATMPRVVSGKNLRASAH